MSGRESTSTAKTVSRVKTFAQRANGSIRQSLEWDELSDGTKANIVHKFYKGDLSYVRKIKNDKNEVVGYEIVNGVECPEHEAYTKEEMEGLALYHKTAVDNADELKIDEDQVAMHLAEQKKFDRFLKESV